MPRNCVRKQAEQPVCVSFIRGFNGIWVGAGGCGLFLELRRCIENSMQHVWTGGVAQRLRVPSALAEDLSLAPSIHIAAHSHL